ncbi:hypothetical protein P106B_46 [Rhizobium phage vB_RglS_P106B]|uniref:Lipoprotein n=1 Tax=Rhizobium phage vB_RglS_P106B TaxID=1458697 RepID=W6E8M3_9CAUD|nr:hypothetical protein P106B_46 [Rhizobium phage vB_RglS_P106B]AHJ10729.1 hypothetical protein P106B_46 [Rhizobium phage vB_RglS_P106B]
MRKLLVTAALVAVTACQSVPPPKPGKVSIPGNYRLVAAYAVRNTLKDPYSVRDAVISQPLTLSGLLIGGRKPGVCVMLNAKNSFGGYTGVQGFTIPFEGAAPVGVYEGTCADAVWTPFVEIMR